MTFPQPRNAELSASLVRVIGLIAALVLLLFGLGLLGRQFWLLDLFSHFRIHYLIALLICGLALLALRRFRAAVAALAAAGAVAGTVVAYTGFPSQPAHAASHGFRFVTFNHYAHSENVEAVGDWLAQSGADAIALQEVDSDQTVARLAARMPGYPHLYAQLNDDSDVAIFSRWPIHSADLVELAPRGNHAARTVIDWNGQRITLIGVHLHWPMGAGNTQFRDAEFEGLAALARATQGPVLIGGDLNITPWSPVFRNAVEQSGLTDCARGHGLVPTWPSWFAPVGIRIDHCLASSHWRAIEVSSGPSLGSDHLAMVNVLELKR